MTKGSKSPDKMESSMKTGIGEKLRDVIVRARDERRVTCGLYDSGLILEMNPDSVMLCVLPLNQTDDISLDIHYTLIEAFCLETGICLLKVDAEAKLRSLLCDRVTTTTPSEENEHHVTPDFNCVLIEYASDQCSQYEGDVLQYHKETCDMVPEPVIELAI